MTISGAEIGLITGAYLFGSLPILYLAARRKGVNLRHAGKSMSGTSVWQLVGPAEGVLFGFTDVLKGAIPVLVGIQLYHLGIVAPEVVCIAGVAAVAGQMWPIFLKFNGGRGNSTMWGVAICLAPIEWLLALIAVVGVIAWYGLPILLKKSEEPLKKRMRFLKPRTKAMPLSWLVAYVILILLCWRVGQPQAIIFAFIAIVALILLRRLTAGVREDLRHAEDKKSVLINRLLYDRSRVHEEVTLVREEENHNLR